MVQKWLCAVNTFKSTFSGSIYTQPKHRLLFATDASVYREVPFAVAIVYSRYELSQLIEFCISQSIPIILRGAGTSLGGQVVGSGLVVDTSHLKKILEININEKWVDVEPGVVLDELNLYLKQHFLYFGPETSTSSRCTIGGMVGNNSCGARSMVYGSTRDQLLEVEGFLSDGSVVTFKSLEEDELRSKCGLLNLEGTIYSQLKSMLSDPLVRDHIEAEFPHADIKRRNNGYALDSLIHTSLFRSSGKALNLSSIIAGSEGTLMVLSRIRLNLHSLPPSKSTLIVAHFASLEEALHANINIVSLKPRAVELMDKIILDLTNDNIEQQRNRSFIVGDPEALLIVEIGSSSDSELLLQQQSIVDCLKEHNLGYHNAIVNGSEMQKVWNLRKAGLGVLSNMKGDAKPVSVIEDCAVRVEDLPAFCQDIKAMLITYNKASVFHGHAGSGELHLRPILNLKDASDVELFRTIATETAHIVKKYKGSLSGEHGDGRVRGEFIPFMVGESNYSLMLSIKRLFDPNSLLNPGKICHTPPMNSSLRYASSDNNLSSKTIFGWPDDMSLLSAAEKCNGSADCIKSELFKGAMCPSYQATKQEIHSPRGRANLIREFLTQREGEFDVKVELDEVVEVLSWCLSCKSCKSECPSNVDISKMKSEIMALYHQKKGFSFRDRLFLRFGLMSSIFSFCPTGYNWLISTSLIKKALNLVGGISSQRALPKLSSHTLQNRFSKLINKKAKSSQNEKRVILLNDEFTNLYNSEVGEKAVKLLQKLGYAVDLFTIRESGRTHLSKGDVNGAKVILNNLIIQLRSFTNLATPIIGLEPSVILTFRDEALDLASSQNVESAQTLSKLCVTFEEFIALEYDKGLITSTQFTADKKILYFHGHCYQKVLEREGVIRKILSIPANYCVNEINSGCCGMGGAFGYEEEHCELSKSIAELVLLPAIRKTEISDSIVTSGFSCKHQIEGFLDRKVKHPAEILFEALLK